MLVEEITTPLSEDWKRSMHTLAGAGAMMAGITGIGVMNNGSVTAGSSSVSAAIPPATPLSARDILALTIWGEARNYGRDGMIAVGNVIKNRASADLPELFGKGIRGVALKPKQFSFWNTNDPGQKVRKNIDHLTGQDKRTWDEARVIAKKLLAGDLPDTTNGALYYHADYVDPYWAKNSHPVAKTAGHIFYRNIPRAKA
jgi:spore germination cell wall hydrolase CwlJ-like protein